MIEINHLILDIHHGSRKLDSTTALATIYDHTYYEYYENGHRVLIQTDLSAAFDTVDHNILIDKLYIHGFKNSCYNLLKSF